MTAEDRDEIAEECIVGQPFGFLRLQIVTLKYAAADLEFTHIRKKSGVKIHTCHFKLSRCSARTMSRFPT